MEMSHKLLYFSFPLLLTGCIGSIITGKTEYLCEDYPDIRTVPCRTDAIAPRCLPEGEQAAVYAIDKKKLAQDLEKIKARNQALRANEFPTQP